MKPSERIRLRQLVRDRRGEGTHPATFLYQFEAAGENLFMMSKLLLGLTHALRLGIPLIRLKATPLAIFLCAGLYSANGQLFYMLIVSISGWFCAALLNAGRGLSQVLETLLGSRILTTGMNVSCGPTWCRVPKYIFISDTKVAPLGL